MNVPHLIREIRDIVNNHGIHSASWDRDQWVCKLKNGVSVTSFLEDGGYTMGVAVPNFLLVADTFGLPCRFYQGDENALVTIHRMLKNEFDN